MFKQRSPPTCFICQLHTEQWLQYLISNTTFNNYTNASIVFMCCTGFMVAWDLITVKRKKNEWNVSSVFCAHFSRYIWWLKYSVNIYSTEKGREEEWSPSLLVQPWLQESLTAKQPACEEKVTIKAWVFPTGSKSKRHRLCPKLWRHECVSVKVWRIRSFTRQKTFSSMESSFFAGSLSVEMLIVRLCLDLMELFILSARPPQPAEPLTPLNTHTHPYWRLRNAPWRCQRRYRSPVLTWHSADLNNIYSLCIDFYIWNNSWSLASLP